MNTTLIGSKTKARGSSRLLNGVGFSSATELLGPYQPPPLVPSCFTATIAATGPTAMVCLGMPALLSNGVAVAAPCKVDGTPCQPSSTVHSRHSGNNTRTLERITSAQ